MGAKRRHGCLVAPGAKGWRGLSFWPGTRWVEDFLTSLRAETGDDSPDAGFAETQT